MNSKFNNQTSVKIFASKESWIEGEAIRQLHKTSKLEGVEYAVGLPDLHPGRGNPVGAAFLIKDIIYPYLIGNDVGCGISLYVTEIKKNKVKINKWIKKLGDLNQPYDDDLKPWLDKFGLNPLYEEAPQAYKNIDQVINDMLNANLIDIIATLKPVITYKNRMQ